jgi:hypothetical protein
MDTTANSVASKRAFSVMNLLYTKSRNRLSVKALDKLSFIYINTRALRSDQKIILDKDDIEEDMLDLEDDFALVEFHQSLFIPATILGKRRRVDDDAIAAVQVSQQVDIGGSLEGAFGSDFDAFEGIHVDELGQPDWSI